MRIYLGADHAGFERKNEIAEHLKAKGFEVIDCGAHEYDAADDYPAFCIAAAEKTVEDSDSGYGLVLLGDYDKAAAARDEFAAAEGFVLSGYSSKRSFDPDAYSAGHAAGERSDIGQTRVRARPALPC
mgnify:CR=1 FL=1